MLLRDFLKIKRIPAAEFATANAMHPSTLSSYMSGRRVVSYECVRAAYLFSEGQVGIMDWPEPGKE
mgnify:CR=1 FL=1